VNDDRFISRPMSVLLDAVRFVSAFLVMVCHMTGPTHYAIIGSESPRLSHYCVIVFFVLSGLVIDASVKDRRTDLKSYAAARLSRIMSVAVPAIVFSALVYWWIRVANGPLSAEFGPRILFNSLTALIFLNEGSFAGRTVVNPAYWSLCYEVWYYALFGAAVFLRGPARIAVLAIMALVAGWKILLLMPVWLAGVWLNRGAAARSIPLDRAAPVLMACAVALYSLTLWDLNVLVGLRELSPLALGMSEWVVSDYAAGVFFVIALAALRPLAEHFSAGLERIAAPVKHLAGFSFTLYLFHPPLAAAAAQLGLAKCENFFQFCLFSIAILAASAAIAAVTERQAPVLRKALDAVLDRKPRLAAALH
jgi:peptidoglycan/LPS O-acetylase OafA/YrhL